MATSKTHKQLFTAPTKDAAGDLTTRTQNPAAVREQQLPQGRRRGCVAWRFTLAILVTLYAMQVGTATYTLSCRYGERYIPELQLELAYSPSSSYSFFIPLLGAIPLLEHFLLPEWEYKKLTIRRPDGTAYTDYSEEYPARIEDLHIKQTPEGLRLTKKDGSHIPDTFPIPESAFRKN